MQPGKLSEFISQEENFAREKEDKKQITSHKQQAIHKRRNMIISKHVKNI